MLSLQIQKFLKKYHRHWNSGGSVGSVLAFIRFRKRLKVSIKDNYFYYICIIYKNIMNKKITSKHVHKEQFIDKKEVYEKTLETYRFR